MEDTGDILLRPIEVATRLGVSIATVYVLMRTGELPMVAAALPGRTKAQRMVPASALTAWESRRDSVRTTESAS